VVVTCVIGSHAHRHDVHVVVVVVVVHDGCVVYSVVVIAHRVYGISSSSKRMNDVCRMGVRYVPVGGLLNSSRTVTYWIPLRRCGT